jgi:hypothetical protein
MGGNDLCGEEEKEKVMGKKENLVSDSVRLAAWEKRRAKLWRNNVGYDDRIHLHYGLKKGSADWIGYAPVVITPDMVGKRICVFLSVETKATTRPSKEQWDWKDNIVQDGGIAVIARKPEDIPDPQKWEFPKP